ncbi:GPN-loop GTPase 3-like [Pollicipes pollicipes]|uniref:GPN-loop GTPase 3-like n=1 Tax=Pollicipes pollicipes TaxID=41117 RepID=UPI001885523A|nr:GPN-loop GTPase 3-like [Pollicipes pollicipes]
MRYGQLVMGPAGSGKSTYCSAMQKHAQTQKRTVHVVNLDPAAEYFDYQPTVDVRDLIQLDDAMGDQELHFGPNGGLVFCIEYLMKNMSWLEEQLGEGEDDYFLFDCPGQIELFTHMDVMKNIVEALQALNFRLCGTFLIDSSFMVEGSKFISGTMAALSVMVNISIPHVNVLTKMDLLSAESRNQLERFVDPDTRRLLDADGSRFGERYRRLTAALARVVDEYGLVQYHTLDLHDELSVTQLAAIIDNSIQYGEDEDVRTNEFEMPDQDGEEAADEQLSRYLQEL